MSERAVTFTEDKPQVFEYEQTHLPEEEKKKEQSEERKAWFMDVMAVSMGIRTPERRLAEVNFEGVAKYIADGKCQNIITMAGAGISTSAGIPDYRSPGTGLFDLLKDKYPDTQNIQDLFNIQFFLKDPIPFFERSRRFFQNTLKPTPCHYFIRLLHEKGLLLRHYTQNIDTLERLAGLPADKVVEAHGSYYTSHCIDCGQHYTFDWMEEKLMGEQLQVPRCEEEDCTGVVKPDIVLYGESLASDFLLCQTRVKTSTPRLYINLDRGNTSSKHPMNALMFGASFDFDAEDNYRDVFKQEKCDTAAYEMAEMIGWKEELHTLVTSEHERIEAGSGSKGKEENAPCQRTDRVACPQTPP